MWKSDKKTIVINCVYLREYPVIALNQWLKIRGSEHFPLNQFQETWEFSDFLWWHLLQIFEQFNWLKWRNDKMNSEQLYAEMLLRDQRTTSKTAVTATVHHSKATSATEHFWEQHHHHRHQEQQNQTQINLNELRQCEKQINKISENKVAVIDTNMNKLNKSNYSNYKTNINETIPNIRRSKLNSHIHKHSQFIFIESINLKFIHKTALMAMAMTTMTTTMSLRWEFVPFAFAIMWSATIIARDFPICMMNECTFVSCTRSFPPSCCEGKSVVSRF